MADASGSSAGGSVSDFTRMGKASMKAQLGASAPNTGFTDALGAVGGVLEAKRKKMDADYKAIYKEKQDAVDAFGKDLESTFVDMGPEMKDLGQESYQKAQNDVYGLREEFVNCAGDKRCEGDVMVKLNTVKTRHSTDAENAKSLVGLWEGELDEDGIRGESSADPKAMTDDERGIMEQFATNKSKRVVYVDDVLNYAWEVPVLDPDKDSPTFGEQIIDPTTGQPMVETKMYTNEQLQEMIPIKETVNGEKLQDYIQAEKEKKGNGQTVADNAALKKSIGDMIPKTQQALKSWAYSNPANQDYLDVYKYLTDHPLLNGQYKKLGIEDIHEPKGIGPEDFVGVQDKHSMIERIMNAEDVNLSHEILTDIYASVSGNEISGAGNVEYNPERHELPNKTNEEVVTERKHAKRQEFYTMLSTDTSPLESMTRNEIIEKYELTPDEVANGVVINGKRVNLDSFLAGPTKKKAIGDTSGF